MRGYSPAAGRSPVSFPQPLRIAHIVGDQIHVPHEDLATAKDCCQTLKLSGAEFGILSEFPGERPNQKPGLHFKNSAIAQPQPLGYELSQAPGHNVRPKANSANRDIPVKEHGWRLSSVTGRL